MIRANLVRAFQVDDKYGVKTISKISGRALIIPCKTLPRRAANSGRRAGRCLNNEKMKSIIILGGVRLSLIQKCNVRLLWTISANH